MTDERDSKLAKRYTELGREEPPAELDAAILAAAHRAAETRPAPLVSPTGRRRWYFPLGAAAVIVLAVAVTVQVEREQQDPYAPVSEAPKKEALQQEKNAPAAAAPAPAEKPRTQASPRPAPSAAPARQKNKTEDRPSAAAAAPPAAQPEAQGPRDEVAASRSAPQVFPGPQARALAKVESPERELERIAELRKQGRDEEADKALAEFRKRYPDFKISDEMLKRVEKN